MQGTGRSVWIGVERRAGVADVENRLAVERVHLDRVFEDIFRDVDKK